MDGRAAVEDVLGVALQAIPTGCRVRTLLAAATPWALSSPEAGEAALLGVVEGECTLRLARTGETVRLERGDLAALPHGDAWTLSDGAPGHERAVELPARSEGRAQLVRLDGLGARCRAVIGSLALARGYPRARSMPPLLVLAARDERAAADPTAALLALIAQELAGGAPGATASVERMFDVLVVQVARRWFAGAAGPSGVATLGDPRVARAVDVLEREAASAWTLASLARRVGVSRSVLAELFAREVGVPPLRYLAKLRLRSAERLLESGLGLAEIADRVGFATTAGLSKAFKRELGATPARLRRELRAARGAHLVSGREEPPAIHWLDPPRP